MNMLAAAATDRRLGQPGRLAPAIEPPGGHPVAPRCTAATEPSEQVTAIADDDARTSARLPGRHSYSTRARGAAAARRRTTTHGRTHVRSGFVRGNIRPCSPF